MKIENQYIPFSQTQSFYELFLDYIEKKETITSFYQYAPEVFSFKRAIHDNQKQNFNRALLVSVLNKQYSAINTKPSTLQQINLLLNNNTFTVCTGHQLCLFTGPLYFIYKIITTINLAEQLKTAYPENHFVPIYWMASEDHDFEEVNHIHLFGKEIKWERTTEQKSAVGKLKTESLENIIEALKPILGESENAKQLIELFSTAYLKNNNLADATRYLVNELFNEYGLLILDADDKELKKKFATIIADDIFNETNYPLVNSTIKDLEAKGYEAQVNPREINVFYMTDEIRERIVLENGKFQVSSLKLEFTKEELEKELESYPERFSPNVVLRPLYQQVLLPNLAYVGGPGEIAYWLEYKSMFNHHNIFFPVLMPRNFVMWIDENSSEQLKKLGLETNNIFKSENELIKLFLNKNTSQEISLAEEEEKLKTLYQNIALKAEKIDVTLKPAVDSELQKQLSALKGIESKIIRAEKQKHENAINKIKKTKEKFFPNNTLQERYDNFIPMYLKHGKTFIHILKNSLNPFEQKLLLIEEVKELLD